MNIYLNLIRRLLFIESIRRLINYSVDEKCSTTHFYCNSSQFGFCFFNKIYNLIRNGNGPGIFFIPEPALWARTHYPNPTCLINEFFYTCPNPPRQASFSPTRFGPNPQPKSWPNNKK